ncbi:MAG: DUF3990 domain-containing protein [Erysipelotrichaceae bacterium]|nr:DUF3990 domain-containing protein [Erysipelotrichaceae bacterium]
MKKTLALFHGSDHIVKKPMYGLGSKYNDYGCGFYCTEDVELGKEWACKDLNTNAYVNKYELQTEGLKILYLDKASTVLNWITILIQNRTFNLKNNIAKNAVKYLKANYSIDISQYDVVIGYRADDSYFTFAKDFLSNTLSLESLSSALRYGKLGEQIVLISEKAFEKIQFVNSEKVDVSEYYYKRKNRNAEANQKYKNLSDNQDVEKETFIMDLIRGIKK